MKRPVYKYIYLCVCVCVCVCVCGLNISRDEIIIYSKLLYIQNLNRKFFM